MAKKERVQKPKKPIFKRVWFWALVVIIAAAAYGATNGSKTTDRTESPASTVKTTETNTANNQTDALIIEEESPATETPSEEREEAEEPSHELELPRKDELKAAISSHVTDNYRGSTIDSITINDDYGTEQEGDYVALVHITWDVKNTGKQAKEVLKVYSSDLASWLYDEYPDVQEIAVFWVSSYLNNAQAKVSYERNSSGMKLSDELWDGSFN